MPGSSLAPTTTAPAPSPNSTQVVRSLKSRMRENTSAPTTSALVAAPLLIIASATVSAYTKPEHTACTSKAAQPWMPSFCCSRQAVDGNTMSGVDVATMIRSISSARTPAASSAASDAGSARSLAVTCGSAK